ncbi:alpha/beta hydrolase [Plebeiibacterium sediminum]|uniref:Alpha/beta hydrolase n=1 Tax=Plebeiibacterium sediminum TaxID=2992112 RepID=A0AAE3M4W4_9BACT|nr:alpha/beta hydrolase [Plebeiobacterium sediminum]MCW3787118.1 alpha/beta hydrolase [Plebeiobacterium sediminum]
MKYLFILFIITLIACNPKKEDELSADYFSETVQYKQIEGIDADLLSLDVYFNSMTQIKKPVVIWVHGGGWSIGDKASQIDNKVNLFQTLDYVFVSVNYRLSPFPYELNNSDRVRYPDHNTDVADAIRWVVDHIDQYGGDPYRMVLMGHSAGAHLVALTGTNASFLTNVGLNLANIKGIAAIDTEGYDVLDQVQDNSDLYINAFGTNEDENIQASPIYNIQSGVSYPKFFIAKRGTFLRLAKANAFIDKLEQNGASVWQVDGSIYTHSKINEAIGAPNETLITNALVDFFQECFN